LYCHRGQLQRMGELFACWRNAGLRTFDVFEEWRATPALR
jgi:hypothetical protein